MHKLLAPLINYLKASIEELQKVAWPTRTETIRYSLLVVGLSLALAVMIGLFDFILSWGVKKVIELVS